MDKKYEDRGVQCPNKIFICEYKGPNSFDGHSHFCVTIAASDSDTARQYVKDQVGIDVDPVWLMGAVHPTIWTQNGKLEAPIQAKILYNGTAHTWSKDGTDHTFK